VSGFLASQSPSGFFEPASVALLWWWTAVELRGTWDLKSQKILPSFRTLTYEAEQTFSGPIHTTEPIGHKPLVVNVVVVGAFQEKEEGIGIASDIINVEGKDPATSVCLRGDRVGRHVGDFQSSLNPKP